MASSQGWRWVDARLGRARPVAGPCLEVQRVPTEVVGLGAVASPRRVEEGTPHAGNLDRAVVDVVPSHHAFGLAKAPGDDLAVSGRVEVVVWVGVDADPGDFNDADVKLLVGPEATGAPVVRRDSVSQVRRVPSPDVRRQVWAPELVGAHLIHRRRTVDEVEDAPPVARSRTAGPCRAHRAEELRAGLAIDPVVDTARDTARFEDRHPHVVCLQDYGRGARAVPVDEVHARTE